MDKPWIDIVEPADADAEQGEAYAEVEKTRGRVANVFKAHSLNPAAMKAHVRLYETVAYGDSPLSRRDRELIAVAVSRENDCGYCVSHHADALGRHVNEPGLAPMVATNYTLANLTDRERAVLDHAVKLTRDPANVTEADAAALRQAGLTDREVLDVTLATAYFNFVNRVVNGLGVPLDDVDGPFSY